MSTSSWCIPGSRAMGRVVRAAIKACRLEAREPAGVRLGGSGDAVRAEKVAIARVFHRPSYQSRISYAVFCLKKKPIEALQLIPAIGVALPSPIIQPAYRPPLPYDAF